MQSIKILSNLSYTTFPKTDDMIEIADETLAEIGKTLQFKGTDGTTEPYSPPTYELTYEQLVVYKIRTVYDLNQELAILRQKEEKPEEYQAYYDFCEQCKAEAKEELNISVG